MTSSLVKLTADSNVFNLEERYLPMPHWLYAVIVLCVFIALLGVVWSFRNSATKATEGHGGKSER